MSVLYHPGEQCLSVRVWMDDIKGDRVLQIVQSVEETGKRQRAKTGKESWRPIGISLI